jgi:hypothetical protein
LHLTCVTSICLTFDSIMFKCGWSSFVLAQSQFFKTSISYVLFVCVLLSTCVVSACRLFTLQQLLCVSFLKHVFTHWTSQQCTFKFIIHRSLHLIKNSIYFLCMILLCTQFTPKRDWYATWSSMSSLHCIPVKTVKQMSFNYDRVMC